VQQSRFWIYPKEAGIEGAMVNCAQNKTIPGIVRAFILLWTKVCCV